MGARPLETLVKDDIHTRVKHVFIWIVIYVQLPGPFHCLILYMYAYFIR